MSKTSPNTNDASHLSRTEIKRSAREHDIWDNLDIEFASSLTFSDFVVSIFGDYIKPRALRIFRLIPKATRRNAETPIAATAFEGRPTTPGVTSPTME